MGYVALQPLRWGDDDLVASDPVPADEPGRDYPGLLHLGLIREAGDMGSEGKSDSALRKELADARAELDKLRTPADGPRLVLSDEESELLAGKGLDGEFSLADLDSALSDGPSPLMLEIQADHRKALDRIAVSLGVENPEELPDIDAVGAAIDAAREAETADADGVLPEGVKKLKAGWYEMPDGSKERGLDAVNAALSKQ